MSEENKKAGQQLPAHLLQKPINRSDQVFVQLFQLLLRQLLLH